MKQWQLKNNSKVELPSGKMVDFLKMDGMFAKWDVDGEMQTGNFDEFEQTENGYKVVEKESHDTV